MDYFRRFTFLFAAPSFDPDDLEGIRFNQIIREIEHSGFEIIKAHRLEDAEIAVKTNAAIGYMMVDWGKKGLEGKTICASDGRTSAIVICRIWWRRKAMRWWVTPMWSCFVSGRHIDTRSSTRSTSTRRISDAVSVSC